MPDQQPSSELPSVQDLARQYQELCRLRAELNRLIFPTKKSGTRGQELSAGVRSTGGNPFSLLNR
jgi:hypothetical protein